MNTIQRTDQTVAVAFQVPILEIHETGRKQPAALARQTAMWIARSIGLRVNDIAAAYKRDPAAVQHARKRVENLRDAEPLFRAAVDALRREVRETTR